MIRSRRHMPFARDDQRLGHQRADVVRLLPGARDVQAFESLVIANDIRRLAMCDLPNELTSIEIDRRNRSVRRLDQRQTIDIHGNISTAGPFLGWLRRIGAGVFSRSVQNLHFFSRGSRDVVQVRNFSWSRHQPDGLDAGIAGIDINVVGFGIVRAAGPVRTAGGSPHRERAERTFQFAHGRRSVDRPEVKL